MVEVDKGGRTEETLREFFLDAGYFVVRGAKLDFAGEHVTDVDLWLYLKGASLSRERKIVDAKDRDRPRALERVLWAVGVGKLTDADRVIVATNDRRPAVRAFAAKHEVDVLNGDFLQRLKQQRDRDRHAEEEQLRSRDRYAEEEFFELVCPKGEKILGDWRVTIELSKSAVVGPLNFQTCNLLLVNAVFFLKEAVAGRRNGEALRAFYCVAALLLIALDFTGRTLVLEEPAVRREALIDGLRYGGDARREVILLATKVADTYGKGGTRVRNQVEAALSEVPVEILAEYLARTEVNDALFDMARRFEAAAYARTLASPTTLGGGLQSIIGVLLDYAKIERKRLFDFGF